MSKTYTIKVEVKGAESGMDACDLVQWLIYEGQDSAGASLGDTGILVMLGLEPEHDEQEVERKLGCEVSVMGWVK